MQKAQTPQCAYASVVPEISIAFVASLKQQGFVGLWFIKFAANKMIYSVS